MPTEYEARPVEREPEGEAWFANRPEIEAACGHEIPDDIWEFVPFGRRVIVVRETPADLYAGVIVIPKTAQSQMTQGWVIAAGQLVGMPRADGQHVSPLAARLLVGRKVLFGAYAGIPFRVDTDPETRAQQGSYMILNDGDLQGELLAAPVQAATPKPEPEKESA